MKRDAILLAIAAFAAATVAILGSHAVAADLTLGWDPVATYDDGTALPAGAVVTYNVYGGIQGQPMVLKDTVSTNSAVRKAIQLGATTCYHVTAVVNGIESVPSNDFCNTPFAYPAAPTNLH